MNTRIKQVLSDLTSHTSYGGIYYSFDQAEPSHVGHGVCRFCAGCIAHAQAGTFCRNNACTGAVQGFAIGDIWYFRCWLGLDSLVVPIAPRGELIGAIEVGGFFSPGGSEKAQETALSRLSSLYSLSTLDSFTNSLQAMEELGWPRVKAIADFLLEATFASGLNDASLFAMRQQINEQQQRLAAKVRELQRRPASTSQTLDSLNRLVLTLRDPDRHQVLLSLDDYLGHVLLNANGERNRAKASAFVLLGLLFEENVHHGTQWHAAMSLYDQQLVELERQEDIEATCFWIEKLVLQHFDNVRATASAGVGEKLSDRVLVWLRENFGRRVTLDDAADELGASVSSIIHRLKAETGRTFSQHLTSVRISEAKRLLAYTSLPLGEISDMCGFNDQSYFTKVFKKSINLTPREFRNMLKQWK
jgi:AraC-like DNA-binding protein